MLKNYILSFVLFLFIFVLNVSHTLFSQDIIKPSSIEFINSVSKSYGSWYFFSYNLFQTLIPIFSFLGMFVFIIRLEIYFNSIKKDISKEKFDYVLKLINNLKMIPTMCCLIWAYKLGVVFHFNEKLTENINLIEFLSYGLIYIASLVGVIKLYGSGVTRKLN